MLFLIYYILPILVVSKILDNSRATNVQNRFQYKLQNLRDELKMLVINKKIEKHNPLFIHLDNIISGSNAKRLNLYMIIFILFFKKSQTEAAKQTSAALERKYMNTAALVKIYQQHKSLIFDYIKERNFPFYFCIIIGYLLVNTITGLFNKSWKNYVTARQILFKRNISILAGFSVNNLAGLSVNDLAYARV